MAKMQAEMAGAPAAPAAPVAIEEPAAAAPDTTPPAVEATTPPASPPEEAAPDYNYSEEPAAPVEDSAATEQPASEPADAVAPVAPAAPAEQPAKPATPVAPAPAPAPQSFVDDLMANPMTLGLAGGGALLLLLVALMALSRRNAMKEAELHEELADDLTEKDAFASDLDMPEDSFADLVDDAQQASPLAGEERVTAQTGDALGEADIYIAYGRFNQAAELLQNAINDEPQRSDLRLKLMEVYAELGDREGFARQDNELREIGGVNAEAEQLKSKYPAMAAFVGAGTVAAVAAADDDLGEFSLDDLTLDEPSKDAPVAADNMDDAFDLSLDDLESDLERDASPAQDGATTLSLDDDLDFGLVDEPTASPATASDDLDFDLALDDDKVELSQPASDLSEFSLDLDEPAPAASDEADDFLLSLDDDIAATAQPVDELGDLGLDLPDETPAVDLDLPADFDLSLEDEAPVQPVANTDSFAAQLDEVTAELDQLSGDLGQPDAAPQSFDSLSSDLDGDDDFDFLSGTDETATKLDLARAYIDMGDTEGARDILDEVIAEGSDAQQQEAREMIAKMV